MKTITLATAYLAIAVFFYTKTSMNMNEELDKREFLTGTFFTPERRALWEFLALVLALCWFVTVPFVAASRLIDENR